ncbi:LysM-repeat proteins and domains [Winogradskyella sp. PG-2]|nr:LysM-repeat proteins and domains [Winogradskyella sp. PG-2]
MLSKKGETKFGISRKFGISINQLENSNPIIKNGLQAGHKLKLPSNSITEEKSINNNGHKVKKGETLWSISKLYNLPLQNLRALNPYVKGNIIYINQTLNISDKKENLVKNDSTYIIQKGDTKFSLSKKFNISISELEEINPKIINTLIAGDKISLIKNTKNYNSEETPINISDNDSSLMKGNNWYIIKPKETLFSLSKKTNLSYFKLIELNPNLKNGVIAGDSIKIKSTIGITTNDSKKTTNKIIFSANIDWRQSNISSKNQKKSISYFQGLNKALNTLSTENPNLNITINSDNNNNSYQIQPIVNFENSLDTEDYGKYTISYTEGDEIKEINLNTLPTKSILRYKMLSFLNSENANIICLHNDKNINNIRVIQQMIPNINMIKLNRKNTFKSNELVNSLDKNRKNYVLIESNKTGVFLSASNTLLREISNYDIQLAVLDYKNIPDESEVSSNRFKVLKMIYPMAFSPSSTPSIDTIKDISYSITYDVLNRLINNGIMGFNDKESEISGVYFKYNSDGNSIKNEAVSIYIYDEKSNTKRIITY